MENPLDHVSFDEDSRVVGVCDFDYEAIYEAIDGPCSQAEVNEGTITPKEREVALALFKAMMGWIYLTGNPQGMLCRCVIACWTFLPPLHDRSMAELARGLGKHKQSLGRWADDFKRKFPDVKTANMKQVKAKIAEINEL